MIKMIYVDKDAIKQNTRHRIKEENIQPTLVVDYEGGTRQFHSVRIEGPSEFVYERLSRGVHVWLETDGPVIVDGGEVLS